MRIPPDSGAIVMGTGIVSAGLYYDGRRGLSDVFLVIAAVAWVALASALLAALARDARRVRVAARSPAALTAVAGSSVLGSRLVLQGWGWAGVALLAVAALLWLGLVGSVLRHARGPATGASFMLTVATESLAILAANLALRDHTGWLLGAAFAAFVLGIGFYLNVFSRFDLHQLALGQGDHWVSGGALAITTLAAAKLALAVARLGLFGGGVRVLQGLALGLWALSMLWLPPLLAQELRHRRLRYDVRRWATVFPVGMYAACSFVVGQSANAAGVAEFARAWVWIGLAVWLAVFIAMLGRGTHHAWAAISAR